MSVSDHEYFLRRAAEERGAADCASCAAAERSHRELAQRYEVAAAAAAGAPVVQLKVGGGDGARRAG
jgi:hypothetical protein